MRTTSRAITATTGIAVIAVVATISTMGATAALAGEARSSPRIVGGERAPSTPWVVQVLSTSEHKAVGGIGVGFCTGEQVTPDWVLTARHCIDPAHLPPGLSEPVVTVHHSNDQLDRGPETAVDQIVTAPSGDLALLHLASPKALERYAALDLEHTAASRGTGVIMGYGSRANGGESDWLYQATVALTGPGIDAEGSPAQHVNGVTGAANHGDSGGPLVVDGRVVGICSEGDEYDPGDDVTTGSRYSLLSHNADWLRRTAGL